jgi:hypothetical protein
MSVYLDEPAASGKAMCPMVEIGGDDSSQVPTTHLVNAVVSIVKICIKECCIIT